MLKKLLAGIKSKEFSNYYPFFFTVIFVFFLFQYSFPTLEAIFYDLRVKFDLGIRFQDNIVLVTMDEESDEFLGEQYPYTYGRHEKLLKRLISDEPKIINYFVNLLNPESDADFNNIAKIKSRIEVLKKQGGLFRFGTSLDDWGEQLPPRELKELGSSLALISADKSGFAKDGVIRRAVLNLAGKNSLHLWTANHYRKFLKRPSLAPSSIWGSYYVRKSDVTYVLFRYYTSPVEESSKIKKISFHRVVTGNYPQGFFKDKIVLIGPNYISNPSDFGLTPFNRENLKTSKLGVHAQIVEALIQNKTVLEIPRNITMILAYLIAIVLSLVIIKVRPTHGLLITISVMLGIVAFSFLLFMGLGLWLYATHLILTVFVVYYIWVPFRAIEEYQIRYAIQEETKLLKQVESLKQNFISLMSHDLKTPVAKIAGLADNLLNQIGDQPAPKKNIISILDSTKELNRFITSILDLTKIESSKLNLQKSSKDINKIIETVIDGLKFEANTKKVEVKKNLSPLYPISIDQNLILRVFSNLIENAIKYSGEGTQVEVETWDDEQWVYIKIKDNGVGIKEEDLKHIFDKFYRVKNDASHTIKGSGLGLYLVKYFVELHGGAIKATSEFGGGTTFEVKLVNA